MTAAPAKYDESVAPCYDRFFGGMAQGVAPRIVALHRMMRPDAERTFADLCCGTAIVARAFLANGYTGVALDSSQAMLRAAAPNVQDAVDAGRLQLIEHDVRTFAPATAYAIATCINGTMNQLPSLDDVRGTMAAAARAVAPGGLFVFDLATDAGLLSVSGEVIRDVPDALLIMRASYDPDEHLGRQEATGFYVDGEGAWRRFRLRTTVRAHDFAWVRSELTAAGFVNVRFTSPDLGSVIDTPGDCDAVFVVAERGNGSAPDAST